MLIDLGKVTEETQGGFQIDAVDPGALQRRSLP